jgi:hypothetical protein
MMPLQAIGNEVAADTTRSAETRAAANSVAVSRAELNELIILKPLGIERPDHRVRAIINAGAVPIEKSVVFQCSGN